MSEVAAALCGRSGVSSRTGALAAALDRADPLPPPRPNWRPLEISTVQNWLAKGTCVDASAAELERFDARRAALKLLLAKIERALNIDALRSAIEALPNVRIRFDEWPADPNCNACQDLQEMAVEMAAITEPLPSEAKVKSRQIGALLDAARILEPRIAQLCALKISQEARREVESRFRYYTWTPTGSRIMKAAILLERPHIAELCSVR
ncbi:MAG TPA: hypothetical protein VGS22_15380 [Thermoanaerobaculia bacterium]|nr:hypothetical protein [Thermoanaerobaculia bacterium]